MRVVMIRHSKTAGNEEHRYIGCTDQPLSENGIALARSAAQMYERELGDVNTVYVTPLKRTQQTASILFPHARQIVEDELREMNFGIFENRSAAQMENDPAYRAWVDGMCEGACPKGERRTDFSERVCGAFARLMRGLEGEAERAVMVLHGGTIMSIGERYALPARSFYDSYFKNCQGIGFDTVWDGEQLHLTHEKLYTVNT